MDFFGGGGNRARLLHQSLEWKKSENGKNNTRPLNLKDVAIFWQAWFTRAVGKRLKDFFFKAPQLD